LRLRSRAPGGILAVAADLLAMPGYRHPSTREDTLPAAVIQVATTVGFLDRVAEVSGGMVPPAPVIAMRPQREAQRPFRRVPWRSGQFDHLVGADAAGVDGLQPGQGFITPRFRLVAAPGGSQEVRRNMRPEDLVRDGQSGECDVVQVLALLWRGDQEGESNGYEEGPEQRPARPEFLQPLPDQPGEVFRFACC